MNFIEYAGIEEQNFLTSLVNFRKEFDHFSELDGIYQAPLGRLRIKEDDQPGLLVGQLYLFVHFYLYFSVSCLMRSHLSECLSSIRKAIDAALSAYMIILDPATADKYLKRDTLFLHIKNNMEREIEKDNSKYPLAHKLIKFHDACSEYGSHADISSFIHRLDLKEIPGVSADHLQLHYFQFPRKVEEYKFYFVLTLQALLMIFEIFRVFLSHNLAVIDPTWEASIVKLGMRLEEDRKKYYSFVEK